MAHVITSLCLRDGACVTVCPVDCIIAGKPESTWPTFYIDPDTCIDCNACVPVCPQQAIFPIDELPGAYTLAYGQYISANKQRLPDGQPLDGEVGGHQVHVANAKALGAGVVVDLSPTAEDNAAFFKSGPGYRAKE